MSERAWIRGPLRITRAVVESMREHAEEAYPSECCGFLFGEATKPHDVDHAQREVNEADRYHAMDPQTFPRTSETYFKIHELRAARTFDEAETSGRPVKAIYHSHCDAGAYFSDEDTATFSQAGALMWPCAFIVVSVLEGKATDVRLWVHRPGEDHFDEAVLEIVEP